MTTDRGWISPLVTHRNQQPSNNGERESERDGDGDVAEKETHNICRWKVTCDIVYKEKITLLNSGECWLLKLHSFSTSVTTATINKMSTKIYFMSLWHGRVLFERVWMIFMAVVYFIIFPGNQETFTLLPAMHTQTYWEITNFFAQPTVTVCINEYKMEQTRVYKSDGWFRK